MNILVKLLNESDIFMNEMVLSGGIDNSGISYLKTSQRSLRVLALCALCVNSSFFIHQNPRFVQFFFWSVISLLFLHLIGSSKKRNNHEKE